MLASLVRMGWTGIAFGLMPAEGESFTIYNHERFGLTLLVM